MVGTSSQWERNWIWAPPDWPATIAIDVNDAVSWMIMIYDFGIIFLCIIMGSVKFVGV